MLIGAGACRIALAEIGDHLFGEQCRALMHQLMRQGAELQGSEEGAEADLVVVFLDLLAHRLRTAADEHALAHHLVEGPLVSESGFVEDLLADPLLSLEAVPSTKPLSACQMFPS